MKKKGYGREKKEEKGRDRKLGLPRLSLGRKHWLEAAGVVSVRRNILYNVPGREPARPTSSSASQPDSLAGSPRWLAAYSAHAALTADLSRRTLLRRERAAGRLHL